MSNTRNDIDYDDPPTRFAYVYRNAPLHSLIAFELIQRCPKLEEAVSKEGAMITILGGGPGSDYFGIQLYRLSKHLRNQLTCWLFDQALWQNCWINVDEAIGRSINVRFGQFDATDPKHVVDHGAILYVRDVQVQGGFRSLFEKHCCPSTEWNSVFCCRNVLATD